METQDLSAVLVTTSLTLESAASETQSGVESADTTGNTTEGEQNGGTTYTEAVTAASEITTPPVTTSSTATAVTTDMMTTATTVPTTKPMTAKSGTGKTTHTNLWLRNIAGSYVVNGDKPIIRMINDTPYVCGTPWMGKEGYGCSRNVPLAAICLLERGAENHIVPADFRNVYPRLIGQAYRPPEGALVAKTVRLLERVGRCVPSYNLFCNMEDEAAIVAFGGMSDDKI